MDNETQEVAPVADAPEKVASPYTPVERLLLAASAIVAQGNVVASAAQEGKAHPMGVFANEYGKIVQFGKPQRKVLIGMVVQNALMAELTMAFVEARQSPEGQALEAKVYANNRDQVN